MHIADAGAVVAVALVILLAPLRAGACEGTLSIEEVVFRDATFHSCVPGGQGDCSQRPLTRSCAAIAEIEDDAEHFIPFFVNKIEHGSGVFGLGAFGLLIRHCGEKGRLAAVRVLLSAEEELDQLDVALRRLTNGYRVPPLRWSKKAQNIDAAMLSKMAIQSQIFGMCAFACDTRLIERALHRLEFTGNLFDGGYARYLITVAGANERVMRELRRIRSTADRHHAAVIDDALWLRTIRIERGETICGTTVGG